ncbi:costars family protein ABRACL [Pyxicephalus adspersus]
MGGPFLLDELHPTQSIALPPFFQSICSQFSVICFLLLKTLYGQISRLTRLIKMNVDHEISLLVEQIHRLGTRDNDGKIKVKFGVLFNDDQCANLFEAMVGTLKAAKRRKILTYDGELLLQGVHDNTEIVLLQE